MSQQRITIDDIAKKLHVSRSLVSKALNDSYGVNAQTKVRIRYAALQMGYNFKNIKRNQSVPSGDIGVLIGNINVLAAEVFYCSLVEQLESACAEHHLTPAMQLLSEFTPGMLENTSRLHLKKGGLLLLRGHSDDAVLLASYGIPFVAVDFAGDDVRVNRVRVDYYRGGQDAVAHFLEYGHRKIGFIGAAGLSDNFELLYDGYVRAMTEAGISPGEFEKHGCTDAPDTTADELPLHIEKLTELLQSTDRPTALLCATDTIAEQVYKIAEELNLRIPADISVIGFDNQAICEELNPPLSSMAYDVSQVARHAVNLLETVMRSPDAPAAAITVDTRLVQRFSVDKPPAD